MGNLFNALNGLKTNIFGGGNAGQTTPILRKSAIGINEESPVSKLDHDPFAYSSIQYPRDLTTNGGIGHYMLFYVNVQDKTKYIYEGTDGETVGNKVEVQETFIENGAPVTKTFFRDGDGSDKFKYDLARVRRGKKGGVLESDAVTLSKTRRKRGSGMSSYHNTTKRITDSVAIYLPPNVQDTTTASYTGAATGVIGAAAAGGFGLVRNMANKDYEAAARGVVESAKAIVGEAAIKAATEIAEGLTGAEGTRGLINKAFGQADNPYMEVLFDAMQLRTFSYNFTFSPKNKQETEDVQKIIALFRFHMSPELKGAANRFLTLPSEFDIHYMYQDQAGQASENDFYNKIATCVCTGCDVNYTPDGVKSFEGGAPTKITMALSFQETELLTKERVNLGF
tara:strand:+ start:53 stop:1240 length:1188 start_codon:yes stop_codon:yes gene_type:complete